MSIKQNWNNVQTTEQGDFFALLKIIIIVDGASEVPFLTSIDPPSSLGSILCRLGMFRNSFSTIVHPFLKIGIMLELCLVATDYYYVN